MFLIIDNTEEEKAVFSFWLNNKFVQRTYAKNKSHGILVFLEKLLSNLKLTLKDITCLGVVVGVGRFTPVRLAVTAVNTLAFSLKIPAIALPKNFDKAFAFKMARSAVAAANAGQAGKYIMPTYSGEARIG